MITPDEGYFFGLGAFETIAIEDSVPVFLQEHLNRLQCSLDFLHLEIPREMLEKKVADALVSPGLQTGRHALKLTVSEKNILTSTRPNAYTSADYERGFTTDFTTVRRNETSPLTYHKTLNYGDCILEKRRAKERNIDEPIFLNTQGAISEGATTNVFFVKNSRIVTPKLSCGLLPGVMRQYLCAHYEIEEVTLYPDDIPNFDEMFLTNSLLGVMAVTLLGDHRFPSRETSRKLLNNYRTFCRELSRKK